jgi:hypothetical protein
LMRSRQISDRQIRTLPVILSPALWLYGGMVVAWHSSSSTTASTV